MRGSRAIEWDGIGARDVLTPALQAERDALADAGHRCDWPMMLAMVKRSPTLANAVRPGGSAGYAPLHQVAHGGAETAVALDLCALGAWRTLRNTTGERPLEIAQARGHLHLVPLLTPVFFRCVPAHVVAAIEARFHAIIRGRAGNLVAEQSLRLPQLSPMLEVAEEDWWFPVPGMYGGFTYRLHGDGPDARLVSSSWCRVVGGSGRRHEITAAGSRLIDSGFG